MIHFAEFRKRKVFRNPITIQYLFDDSHSAPIWLVIRLYVGWEWLSAGFEKVLSPAWIGPNAGGALKGFVLGALTKVNGPYPDVQSWYAWFLENIVLQNLAVMSHIVAIGQVLVGLGLLVGLFVGIAAFFGCLMNFNFLLSGTVSTNPILLILGIFLVLAWKVAGYIGLDYFALRALGTPWMGDDKGVLFEDHSPAS